MSQRVERTWIRTGGYGANGLNHSAVMPQKRQQKIERNIVFYYMYKYVQTNLTLVFNLQLLYSDVQIH